MMTAKQLLQEITPPFIVRAYRNMKIRLMKRVAEPLDKEAVVKTHIFVACFPKSGSTYLTTLMSELTGFPIVEAYWPGGHNEQDIFLTKLQELSRMDSVTQQHVKGTGNNIRFMQRYGIKPVILVRNIFDVVLSIHDHVDRVKHRSGVGYFHEEYFQMEKYEKTLFLTHIFLPWYFNFLVSWREASQNMDTLWVTYEELFLNQLEVVAKILNFYNLSFSIEHIQATLTTMSSKDTRLNVGVSGRGQELPDKQKEAILNLARVWKIDRTAMEILGIYL